MMGERQPQDDGHQQQACDASLAQGMLLPIDAGAKKQASARWRFLLLARRRLVLFSGGWRPVVFRRNSLGLRRRPYLR